MVQQWSGRPYFYDVPNLMKNQYQFEQLSKIELSRDVDEASIFLAMYELSVKSTLISSFPTDEFEKSLSNEQYHVANKLVTRKGKKLIFSGKVVLAEKLSLISFLKKAITKNDLRPLLISPRFSVKPKQVIFISEDECHSYLANLP